MCENLFKNSNDCCSYLRSICDSLLPVDGWVCVFLCFKNKEFLWELPVSGKLLFIMWSFQLKQRERQRQTERERAREFRHSTTESQKQMNKATQNLAAESQAAWRRTSSETLPVGSVSKVVMWRSHGTAKTWLSHILWTEKLTFRHLFIKARQVYIYSTFHTQRQFKVFYIMH